MDHLVASVLEGAGVRSLEKSAWPVQPGESDQVSETDTAGAGAQPIEHASRTRRQRPPAGVLHVYDVVSRLSRVGLKMFRGGRLYDVLSSAFPASLPFYHCLITCHLA